MLEINHFESVFGFNPDYAYSNTTYQQILSNRRTLHNKLYLDRLLDTLQVKVAKLYPPKTNHDLRELHHKIVASQIADHHKQSLLFYILLDCKAPSEVEPAIDFSRRCFLPQKYWVCVQGLWHMDRLHFQAALDSLTQPTLLPTFSSDILATLLDHYDRLDKAVDLPLAYYNTVMPPLTPYSLLEKYFTHVANMSIPSAYDFIHRQPVHLQRQLLEHLLDIALAQRYSAPDERVERALELVDLPFSAKEEEILENYLLEGKGRNVHGAGDMVVLRRVTKGKLESAMSKEVTVSGRRLEGLSWETLRDALGKSLGPRAEGTTFKPKA